MHTFNEEIPYQIAMDNPNMDLKTHINHILKSSYILGRENLTFGPWSRGGRIKGKSEKLKK